MLKSILLRMLAFALTFVVGVANQSVFNELREPVVSSKQPMIKSPIRLEIVGVCENSTAQKVCFALCNDSPYSIWVTGFRIGPFYEEQAYNPYFVTQYWRHNQWLFRPTSGTGLTFKPIEIKPKSRFRSKMYPMRPDCTQRIGIGVYWKDSNQETKGWCYDEPPWDEQFKIWSAPFSVHYKFALQSPIDPLQRKN